MGRRRNGFRVVRGGRRDPLRFWPEAKRKPSWTRYLPLWSGAVAVGLMVGLWPGGQQTSDPDKPILWNETQAVPQAVADPSDRQWASRAQTAEETTRASVEPANAPVSFRYCHTGGGTNCVVDGDTIWIGGHNVRIADIDAPETHEPRCPEELALGQRATERLHEIVNSGSVTLESAGREADRYGRLLRLVLVDGVSVGDTLVGEGLARPYADGKRPWC